MTFLCKEFRISERFPVCILFVISNNLKISQTEVSSIRKEIWYTDNIRISQNITLPTSEFTFLNEKNNVRYMIIRSLINC